MSGDRNDNDGVTAFSMRVLAPERDRPRQAGRRRIVAAVSMLLLSVTPLAGGESTTRLLTQAGRDQISTEQSPADDMSAPDTPSAGDDTMTLDDGSRADVAPHPGSQVASARTPRGSAPTIDALAVIVGAPSIGLGAQGSTGPALPFGDAQPGGGGTATMSHGGGAEIPVDSGPPDAAPREVVRPIDPSTPEPVPEPPPDRDQVKCPNLGKVAIGDTTGAPPDVAALSSRFRAFASAELGKENLVCADPMKIWRGNLVIQHLWVRDQSDGALVTGIDEDSPIMRLDRSEFRTMGVNLGGPPDLNYIGAPLRRTTISGVPVVVTTEGGLVMERPDQIGQIVLGGAWDRWIASGGPAGPMGMPMYKPSPVWELPDDELEAMGIAFEPGATPPGAYQDFAGGYLFLPDVASELEAFQADADALEWHPRAVDAEVAGTALHGSIIKVGRRTYYVDRAGLRHWLEHPSEHGCARPAPESTPQVVRGWVAAQFQPGRPNTCGGS